MSSTSAQQLRAAPGAAAAAALADPKRQLAGKKRKAGDKAGSEKAVHLIPESALFNSLMMQQQHVNRLIKRRRLELQAASNPLECPAHKRLRVYIYSTHSHQPNSSSEPGQDGSTSSSSSSSSEPPQWTLHIWGRLEAPDPPPAAAAPAAAAAGNTAGGQSSAAAGTGGGAAADGAAPPAPPAASSLAPQPAAQQPGQQHKYPMTGFFRRIEIQLDPQHADPQQANNHIMWDKLQHRGPHKDRIEFKRIGTQPVKVTITFEQDFLPPAYQVDPRLAEVLGMTFGQQQMVLTRLYSYIISATPQADLNQLQLDGRLEAIFGTKQMPAAALPQALGKLLQPLEPITVSHTVETAGPSPGGVTCVDFDVLMPTKLQDRITPAVDALLEDKASEQLEQKLVGQLNKLFEARRRRSMYLGFAQDPVSFLNTIIASQARELRSTHDNRMCIERRTDVFRDKWVDEAALHYLGRKNKVEGFVAAPTPQQQQGP